MDDILRGRMSLVQGQCKVQEKSFMFEIVEITLDQD